MTILGELGGLVDKSGGRRLEIDGRREQASALNKEQVSPSGTPQEARLGNLSP